MVCKKPFMLEGTLPVGCGQCLPCRIQRRRLWAHRQIMESMCHGDSIFVTLTYDEKTVPTNSEGAQVLSREDFTNWLKRLRERVGYGVFRYFGCGEYGPATWRPHYHVNLFGLSVYHHRDIQETWGQGFTSVFPFEGGRAQYCAEYTVKKMTRVGDWRLDGRTPEFAAMSRNPGIGKPFVIEIAKRLYLKTGWDITKEKDVPKKLHVDGKNLMLGRYLRHMLREEIGMTDEWKEALKQEWVSELDQEMFPLRIAAKSTKKAAQQLFVEKNMGRIASIEARSKLRRSNQL